jgi:hypothetical protein
MRPIESTNHTTLTAGDLAHLANQKVFFGHQSVGDDIVRGLRGLVASEPCLKLRIVHSADPQLVTGPAFVEAHIGCNADPQSKAEAFSAIVEKGMGREGGIAMYKYCYVDVGTSTEISRMFEMYRSCVDTLKAKFPLLRIVHITIPLTTVEPAVKGWAKRVLGRATARDLNRKRNEYNRLLVQVYGRTDPVFDLAEVESTRRDGLRSEFSESGQQIFALAPEFTTDGGHLNETGRRIAAETLLLTLAKL